MARKTSVIQQSIITALVSALAVLGVTLDPTTWSAYDYRQLISYAVAVAMSTQEQLWDAFEADLETLIASASPQTPEWLRQQMLLFQYSATDPQIIQFDSVNTAPYYPTVDASKRIITNCSVVPGIFGTTLVKVAKGGTTPVALATDEVNAAQSYINLLAIPGIIYTVQSLNADRLYAELTVRYNGQYSAIIKNSVVAAIQAYLLGIPFNGYVRLDDLLESVRLVPGVNSAVLNNISTRTDLGSIGDYPMVTANTWVTDGYATVAGYIQGETTTGSTLNDTITYIAE
jgi:hypothetical protein